MLNAASGSRERSRHEFDDLAEHLQFSELHANRVSVEKIRQTGHAKRP